MSLPMRDIKAHTGLRGIAATTVFLAHAEFDHLWRGAVWFGSIYRFFYWQSPAVDLFFMLSGFILNYVYLRGRRLEWGSFFNARFARICPLYYAGLAAVLGMNAVAVHLGHTPSVDLKPSVILPNLAMLQEWPFLGVTSVNIPSWSISVEVFLYVAVFPFFAWLLSGRKLSRGVYASFLIIALLIDALLCTDSPFPLNPRYSGLLRGITGFSAGFMICELVYAQEEPVVPLAGEIGLAVAVFVLLPFRSLHVLLPAAFASLIAATYHASSRLGRILGSPFFAYLGGLSYSIYIWQFPVIKGCTLAFGVRDMGGTGFKSSLSPGHKFVYCLGTTLTLALVANVSYYFFESPLRRALRRDAPRRNVLPQAG